ncbi:hypothetical protein NXF25_010250 [Crotalus adamanteus]|uniref:Retrotransposon gag domain-containing protein n=1 Tax=Crotalus adamanteus TaxID=8729 RepID=A0AAW1BHZ8_CROAD
MAWHPPPLQAMFSGNPDHMVLFLSQVISHLDQYACFYPSQWAMVLAVTVVLQAKAAEWVADLHSNHARKLADAGLFLEALRSHFEDVSQVQHAKGELLALKQRGQSAAEYVREFQ